MVLSFSPSTFIAIVPSKLPLDDVAPLLGELLFTDVVFLLQDEASKLANKISNSDPVTSVHF